MRVMRAAVIVEVAQFTGGAQTGRRPSLKVRSLLSEDLTSEAGLQGQRDWRRDRDFVQGAGELWESCEQGRARATWEWTGGRLEAGGEDRAQLGPWGQGRVGAGETGLEGG